ncbi:MAG: alpha/beta fold hydrolase [Gemmataceae bacterium]
MITFALASLTTIIPLVFLVPGVAQSQKPDFVRLKEWFNRHNRDNNGKLSPQEHPNAAVLKKADKDGDNQLTLTEVTAFLRSQSKGQRRRIRGALPKTVVMQRTKGLAYVKESGADHQLLSLDVYAPKQGKDHPVMVFIHGGGWRKGDKANAVVSRIKAPHFVGADYVLVSINYRLSPKVQHPTHVQDVAKALAYVHEHIANYGGDPNKMFIMGHSAGAHLAALVAVDERYLRAVGNDLNLLSGVVLLDSAAYDIPRFVNDLKAGPTMVAMYKAAFGPEKNWKLASPLTHVAPQKNIPPFLIFHTDKRLAGATLSRELADALKKAGSPAKAVHAWDKDHATMNSDIGRPGDWATKMVMAFLKAPRNVTQLAPEGRPAKAKVAAKGGLFDKLDSNRDKKLSRKEFQRLRAAKKRPKLFDAIDADRDGFITREESRAFQRRRTPKSESTSPRRKFVEEQ